MKNKILYLECNSGISGDMTVAALLDLGADRRVLEETLASLPLDGYRIEIKDVFKSGIRACDFNVILDHDNHDHDMNYLHGDAASTDSGHLHNGHEHPHEHEHLHDEPEHSHKHEHLHEHEHTHEHHEHELLHGHEHPHDHHDARNLHDVTEILRQSRMTKNALDLAVRIFEILANAEAKVHGKSVEEVHFHEVGAVDSIVDIAAAAICLDNLAPNRVIVSPLTDGTGQIRCQHGIIPVPVPAVAAISEQNGLILKLSNVQGELVTPTGAAIAAALRSENGNALPAEFRILRTGFGAGKRDYATTGVLRAMLVEDAAEEQHDIILNLETNIDDCSAEALSYTMQQLFENGALDVFYTPIYMKKNRPAYLLRVICRPEHRKIMESIIFSNTTTIGIRVQETGRTKLERRIVTLETPWGMADVKCCAHDNKHYYYPENNSVAALARKNGIGFPEMYSLLLAYAGEHIEE